MLITQLASYIASCQKTHTDIFHSASVGVILSCDDATREFSKRLEQYRADRRTWVGMSSSDGPARRRSCPRGLLVALRRWRGRPTRATAAPALSAARRAADASCHECAGRWQRRRVPMRTARNPSRAKVTARPRTTRPPRSGPRAPGPVHEEHTGPPRQRVEGPRLRRLPDRVHFRSARARARPALKGAKLILDVSTPFGRQRRAPRIGHGTTRGARAACADTPLRIVLKSTETGAPTAAHGRRAIQRRPRPLPEPAAAPALPRRVDGSGRPRRRAVAGVRARGLRARTGREPGPRLHYRRRR